MKTTKVPTGAATATINEQIRSLEALIDKLSEEVNTLEAKIGSQENSQAQEAEKDAAKMKDLENQIENPKNEEYDIDPEVTRMQDAIIDALWELDPYDKYGPGGEIEKELDAWSKELDDWREHVESQKDVDINDPEFSLMPPRPRVTSLFPKEMFRRG
ncbi:hypothetical protein FIE12Z_3595 [Fusarium flagelliforme]|uniref:Uncharacterized protein n=1 Tax=Fusarium flagelliforme TaxID=2675880 RepID=A0A395MX58_9HYPO|nr:hypothetical protein FIE12Z_3595 [Fusarium flagelliforme]